ncbi:hypothetical protein Tco_0915379 [Tanacetum coccineum]
MKKPKLEVGKHAKTRRRSGKIGFLEGPSSPPFPTSTPPLLTVIVRNLGFPKVPKRKYNKNAPLIYKNAPLKCKESGWREEKYKGIKGVQYENRDFSHDQEGRGTMGMVGGKGYRKIPYEKMEQWMDNEISFPSVPRCRLVDSPIVLEAYIEGFQVRMIYVDGGSSSEVMYEHCFRNIGIDTKALRECRRIEEAQGPTSEGKVTHPRIRASKPAETSEKEETQIPEKQPPMKKYPEESEPTSSSKGDIAPKVEREGKDEPPEVLKKSRPSEKVLINDGHPNQPITIGGSLSAECRSKLIRTLRKHVAAFAWTPADMTGITRFVAEHQLKTYPHIEPRVHKKRSLALDIRKVVKEEVEE